MTIKHLVFAGAGVRIPSYAGALLALEEADQLGDLQSVAGASSGAIIAMLVSLGYTPEEIAELTLDLEPATWLDAGFFSGPLRLLTRYGWHAADALHTQLQGWVKRKTGRVDSTFADCAAAGHKALHVIGWNVSKRHVRIFPDAISQHMPIAGAVRIAFSIPLLFASVPYQGDLYSDGSALWNYPLSMFDAPGSTNTDTLGVCIESSPVMASARLWTPHDYFVALFEALTRRQERELDQTRTIAVADCGVAAGDFKLTRATKQRLLEAGIATTRDFLAVRRARISTTARAEDGSGSHTGT